MAMSIDLVGLTHDHADHTRGARALVDPGNGITVGNVVDNGPTDGWSSGQTVLQRYAKENVEVGYEPIEGDSVARISGITSDVIDPLNCPGTDPEFTVLWGSLSDDPGWPSGFGDENNNSIAVKVVFGESSFLFTGDMEEESLDTLVAYYEGTGSGGQVALRTMKPGAKTKSGGTRKPSRMGIERRKPSASLLVRYGDRARGNVSCVSREVKQ